MEISPIGKMPDLEKLGFDTEVDEDEESEEGGRTSDEEVEVVAIHEHLCIDVEKWPQPPCKRRCRKALRAMLMLPLLKLMVWGLVWQRLRLSAKG